jgi:hypothetical protein
MNCESQMTEQIIGKAALERKLTHGNAATGRQIDATTVLHLSAGGGEQIVNIGAGASFRRDHRARIRFVCSESIGRRLAHR